MPGAGRSGSARSQTRRLRRPRRPAGSRARAAAAAILDTIGVALAGAAEPAARIVQQTVGRDRRRRLLGLGTRPREATGAALANGTAAHALDYDDMCFVSLAHPSAPLVPAILAAAELSARPAARWSTPTSSASRSRRGSAG